MSLKIISIGFGARGHDEKSRNHENAGFLARGHVKKSRSHENEACWVPP